MSEQVRRYDIGSDCEDAWIQYYTDGDYVLYTDYTKLEAECAALQSKVDTLMAEKHKAVWDAEKIALREALKLLHENCLYQLGEGDDRVTHVRHDIYETVEAALKEAGGL